MGPGNGALVGREGERGATDGFVGTEVVERGDRRAGMSWVRWGWACLPVGGVGRWNGFEDCVGPLFIRGVAGEPAQLLALAFCYVPSLLGGLPLISCRPRGRLDKNRGFTARCIRDRCMRLRNYSGRRTGAGQSDQPQPHYAA